jgi:hypothetical protein
MSELGVVSKIRSTLPWLPGYIWQQYIKRPRAPSAVHLVIGVANHFEPSIRPEAYRARAHATEQLRRVEMWCDQYPATVRSFRDDDGQPFRHTYFYPAEEYEAQLIDRLAEHCHLGWGEIEIHLHHGLDSPDSADNTRRTLLSFRDSLFSRGCLSQENGIGPARYGFVHGNWALANSANGRYCGVDNEMEILAETGCYADFTLPSAPSTAQISKINALYECMRPLGQAVAHRRGRDLRLGRPPKIFPLIVQGPLMIDLGRRKRGWPFPGIENGELTTAHPPTIRRLNLWKNAGISVDGRPNWLFIKLHCHGMDPRDESAMHGELMTHFLRDLADMRQHNEKCRLHFVTMREMVNIILAACDGQEGNPNRYRDYRFRRIRVAQAPSVGRITQ